MNYTEKDLVDFGNQVLSEKREVLHEGSFHGVTDADLDAFRNSKIGEDNPYMTIKWNPCPKEVKYLIAEDKKGDSWKDHVLIINLGLLIAVIFLHFIRN